VTLIFPAKPKFQKSGLSWFDPQVAKKDTSSNIELSRLNPIFSFFFSSFFVFSRLNPIFEKTL